MEQAVKLLTKLKIVWKKSSVSVAAVGCFVFYSLHEAAVSGQTDMGSIQRCRNRSNSIRRMHTYPPDHQIHSLIINAKTNENLYEDVPSLNDNLMLLKK
jgi:hypothetical protein